MIGRNTELRRRQSRKLAAEALGLKHADMTVCRAKRPKRKRSREEMKAERWRKGKEEKER